MQGARIPRQKKGANERPVSCPRCPAGGYRRHALEKGGNWPKGSAGSQWENGKEENRLPWVWPLRRRALVARPSITTARRCGGQKAQAERPEQRPHEGRAPWSRSQRPGDGWVGKCEYVTSRDVGKRHDNDDGVACLLPSRKGEDRSISESAAQSQTPGRQWQHIGLSARASALPQRRRHQ